MTEPASIRPERMEDSPAIREVNSQAFGRAQEADLVDALRDTQEFIPELSLIAERDDQLVGHILLCRIAIRAADGERIAAVSLGPMSVIPPWQRQGVGSALVREGLRRAALLGHGIAVVLGHPGYYPRFGFGLASLRDISAPWDVPDEAFLVKELIPARLSGVSGEVEYPAAFDAASEPPPP